ncbi:putative hydroxyacylglutathione hydrolase [Seiridium unicorne]|uniref:hydroxyacylglutathione hydrolase n=1 Tax=Seiridium unicorne TaxID=138068 RepID=A0ABR2VHY1_9PEZI
MVQYIHTPWRDRAELLEVRRQLYPAPPRASTALATTTASPATSSAATAIVGFADTDYGARGRAETDQRRHAVSRVAMWVQRGSCPHMVESTGLLMAAILDDLDEARSGFGGKGSSAYKAGSTSAVRLAYSAAFSRFVTGLLDSHQDKQMKQSMYSIAKTIGLPATFVELRHQCTHEQLPSLLKLRSAAQKSLVWIWDYYWKHLTDDEYVDADGDNEVAIGNTCIEMLSIYLLTDDVTKKKSLGRRLKQWDDATLLQTLTDIGETAEDHRLLLRSLQLSQQILDGRMDMSGSSTSEEQRPSGERDLKAVQEEMMQVTSELETLQPVERPRFQETSIQATTQGKRKRLVLPLQLLAPAPAGLLHTGMAKPGKAVLRFTSSLNYWTTITNRQSANRPTKDQHTTLQDKINESLHETQIVPTRQIKHIYSRCIIGVGSSDNYAYLVIDDKSKDAVIIDPANPEEVAPVLKKAIQDGKINLTAIVNTHHHWDHAGGNKRMLQELGNDKLPIIGGKECDGVTETPANGNGFKLGSIAVKGLYTPCHTQDSICWFMQDGDDKVVFTGDTLFHGGCGRFFEGSATEMHKALNNTLASLPNDTKVYPGHEYTKSNVKFGISVLQSEAVKKLQSFAENNKETQGKFTIGDEKEHNVFMRVEDPQIQKATGETDPVSVMAKLREMKNNFK